MQKIDIAGLLASGQDGQNIQIFAWVQTKRQSKQVGFLSLSDGSCHENLQAVISIEQLEAYEQLKDINTGAAVSLEGSLHTSPAKGQKWEVQVTKLEVVGEADTTYPLQKKGHSLEFLREIAHLRPRTRTFGAVFRLRHTLAKIIHEFFDQRRFFWVHTPIITPSDCEGAGELFTVTSQPGKTDFESDFFARQAYLTVSGQLQAEFMALAMSKVYTFGPTFRAENSNTSRHLAEFWMVEPEVAFCNLEDLIDLAGDFVRYQLKHVLEACPEELQFFSKFYKRNLGELLELSTANQHKVSYTDAIEILRKTEKKFTYEPRWGEDLQTEHERFLSEEVFKGPVAVFDYPKEIKAFYMRLNDDEKTVAAVDVLLPGVGELIGGSQREERLDVLKERMGDLQLDWYVDLRRHGSVPHAGFGMGFERMLMYISGMQNIRDVIISPRSPKSLAF